VRTFCSPGIARKISLLSRDGGYSAEVALDKANQIRSDYGRGAPRDLVRNVNGHDRRTFFARLHIHLTNPGAPIAEPEFVDRNARRWPAGAEGGPVADELAIEPILLGNHQRSSFGNRWYFPPRFEGQATAEGVTQVKAFSSMELTAGSRAISQT
jgi:hypothetical protein